MNKSGCLGDGFVVDVKEIPRLSAIKRDICRAPPVDRGTLGISKPSSRVGDGLKHHFDESFVYGRAATYRQFDCPTAVMPPNRISVSDHDVITTSGFESVVDHRMPRPK